MPRRRSLRRRVALAFATLGAGLSALLCVAIWFAAHDVSQRLMDQTLREELADYMARHARNPASLPPATASLRGYHAEIAKMAQALPAPLQSLAPGQHEVDFEGIPYRVAVADRNGERYLILFDEARQKRREQRFLAYVLAAALALTLFSAVLGFWLAGRVVAPVTELARAVKQARPEAPPRLPAATPSVAGDDEIGELANAFESYLERLAAFVERERDFAADASHELRTPLAVIRGAAEIIAADPGLDPGLRERVARIERASSEMTHIVEALLLLARESGLPDNVHCDAGRLARECVERHRPQAVMHDSRIELDAGSDVSLPVPAALFAMVLANLVRNAVAHSQAGTIRIQLDPRALVVSDEGVGIDADEQERVFERFYRGSQSKGAGIGLSLVRRICDRLGWRIELASQPSSGTSVRIDFTAA